jgi:hypothetical protein
MVLFEITAITCLSLSELRLLESLAALARHSNIPLCRPLHHQTKASTSTKPFLLRVWNQIIASLLKYVSVITKLRKRIITAWDRIASPFQHSRWRVLGSCSIHILPVAISTTLLALNFLC